MSQPFVLYPGKSPFETRYIRNPEEKKKQMSNKAISLE